MPGKVAAKSLLNPAKIPVTDLRLSDPRMQTWVHNILRRNDIHTVAQLLRHSERDLMDMRNFSHGCLAQLTAALKTLGFSLRQEQR